MDVSARDRRERRPANAVYAERDRLALLAAQLGVQGRDHLADYDPDLSTDDLV